MKLKAMLQTTTVLLAAAVTSSLAANITVNSDSYARMGAWGANIGNTCQQVINNDSFTGWVKNENGEYRVGYEFRLDTLGITPAEVSSATLKFTANPWNYGRDGVTVDQIASNLVIQGNEMYETAQANVLSNGSNQATYTVDITSIFKAALAVASSTQGLALRFYNNNTALPVTYDGTNVLVSSGYTQTGVFIDVVVPEPAALGLLAFGGLTLLRRRRCE